MEPDFDFDTMKNIGGSYSLTSHQLGKILKQHGFRDDQKPSQPTSLAEYCRMIRKRFDSDGTHFIWEWHVKRTCMLLERLGHERKTHSRPE